MRVLSDASSPYSASTNLEVRTDDAESCLGSGIDPLIATNGRRFTALRQVEQQDRHIQPS
jgi:hypothetical protein